MAHPRWPELSRSRAAALSALVKDWQDLGIILALLLVNAVAAIPVAMPTVLSVTMALGARLLARMKAIVTRLASSAWANTSWTPCRSGATSWA